MYQSEFDLKDTVNSRIDFFLRLLIISHPKVNVLTFLQRAKETKVTVNSLGDRFAEKGLRGCLAMGVDRATHIEDEDYEKRDPWATATILASSILLQDPS